MISQKQAIKSGAVNTQATDFSWRNLYRIGGIAALGTVVVGLVEIGITFLPGGNTTKSTVFDWFTHFQNNPFMGLRDLGLLNILFYALDIPIFFALFIAHRKSSQTLAALAMIVSFIGVAVFYSTNRAFAMLDLSNQFVLATSEVQRSILAAAGQAMLSVGQSHTPGTFLAFFLSESASLLVSAVLLRGRLFSKANVYVGFIGFSFMLIFEICASFGSSLQGWVMILAMVGGILSLIWEVLVALRLFQLSRTY